MATILAREGTSVFLLIISISAEYKLNCAVMREGVLVSQVISTRRDDVIEYSTLQ